MTSRRFVFLCIWLRRLQTHPKHTLNIRISLFISNTDSIFQSVICDIQALKRFMEKCHYTPSHKTTRKRSLQKSVDNIPTCKETSDFCKCMDYHLRIGSSSITNLKMKAIRPFETSGTIHKPTRHTVPEDTNFPKSPLWKQ
jgi:hypothetical protein